MNLIVTYQNAAFIFLLIPLTALLRGVFQGSNEMKPTAYSQIGEQSIRVFIIIFAAVLVAEQGSNIYHIGEAAGKIGRASCREREEAEVVSIAIREEKTKDT